MHRPLKLGNGSFFVNCRMKLFEKDNFPTLQFLRNSLLNGLLLGKYR